ncbi:hypothetical protein C1H46_035184 [Malus baccata]|uniref:Uncharacterized protein n=1 Tax=Malus baccata TaxID=106549 RepID=A0A540KYI4_MALBA|nr:hypothetical protein C1H46_035184 [Malus baccata]
MMFEENFLLLPKASGISYSSLNMLTVETVIQNKVHKSLQAILPAYAYVVWYENFMIGTKFRHAILCDQTSKKELEQGLRPRGPRDSHESPKGAT